ncbi:MAG TPA: GNAT family N-acetyltransferase [Gemmatimonadaceae bacterium]|nr:GNAT family N-acetyltransferase [Gemmatimonadaceae bacterium]
MSSDDPTLRAPETAQLLIRDSRDDDLGAITAIYAHYVPTSAATFETEPPDLAEMTRRRAAVLAAGLPYLIAEVNGAVAGYAYATIYRGRLAYRFTAEDSIYVHHAYVRAGIGRALLAALIESCEARGCRQMIAVISDGVTTGSIRLHERAGFEMAGTLRSVGFKFGRWIDTVRMQRALGEGDSTLPEV